MKKRVYDYICNHPNTTIHPIAAALNEEELDILKIVNALCDEGHVTLGPIMSLSLENDDSCRYIATGKKYSGE